MSRNQMPSEVSEDCFYLRLVHWPGYGAQIKRVWCALRWAPAGCTGCPNRDPRPQALDCDGVKLLAAAIIEECIAQGNRHIPGYEYTPLDVALEWAVMCGKDPHEVAPAILERAINARYARSA